MANFEKNRGNDNCIPLSGIGFVVIPQDANSAEYVQRCYRNHMISISGGYDNSYMHNVKITIEALNQIHFPDKDDELGSPVVWIRDSFTNRPVVIGVLKAAGESNLSQQHQQRIFQETAEQIVEIFLDALRNQINITAVGGNSVPGRVVIKAASGTPEGDEIKLESKDVIKINGKTFKVNLTKNFEFILNNGKTDLIKIVGDEDELHLIDHWNNEIVLSEENISVTDHFKNSIVTNEENVKISDHFENEVIMNDSNVQIIAAKKFNVGQGEEQMVLGNTLVNILGELIDAILSLTVVTHVGPSGTPVNAAQFSAVKSKLETILSKLSNTD